MADEKRDVDNEKGRTSMEEDPDFYVPTAATWGHLDLIRDWLPLQDDNPSKVTELVLFPAAMYGQLEVLVHALPYGEPPSWGWTGVGGGYARIVHATGSCQ